MNYLFECLLFDPFLHSAVEKWQNSCLWSLLIITIGSQIIVEGHVEYLRADYNWNTQNEHLRKKWKITNLVIKEEFNVY